jgi:hypothetical protein
MMLDRGMGVYLPYIFNEVPELAEQFDGFTAYLNTISYSGNTNFAAPALFGGYEYTPEALNARNLEPISQKHGVPIQKSIMFFMRMLPVFLALVRPASQSANPACMK